MEELEKKKMSKDNKIMIAITAPHIRALVDKVNDLNIPREDIVSLVKDNDQLILICYK